MPSSNTPGSERLPLDTRGLNAAERSYREAKLRDIEERIHRNGLHVAQAHPGRAKQFMPFAALKGYHQLLEKKEAAAARRFKT